MRGWLLSAAEAPRRCRGGLRGVALVCFLLFLPFAAAAQSASPAAPTTPSVEQLQQLVSTLKDDKARAQLIAQLQALIAAQAAVEKPRPTSPLAWLSALAQQIDDVAGEILGAVPIFVELPHAASWIELQVSDPELRQRWIGIIERLAIIFGTGIAAGWIVRWVSRPVAERLTRKTSDRWPARILLLFAGALFEALPVLTFAATAAFVLPLTTPRIGTGGVANAAIAAAVWTWGALAVARIVLLSPAAQSLYAMTDETRNYLYIWLRRVACSGAVAYAVAASAWWLNAPSAIVGLLIRISVLVLGLLAIVFVLQNRGAVADWLRRNEDGPRGGWRALCNRLAEIWHILAIVSIIGIFGFYLLNPGGGISLLLRAAGLSVIIIVAAGGLVRFLGETLRRGFSIKPEIQTRFPRMEARANRYVSLLYWMAAAAIYFLAAIALLQAWGLNAFSWVESTADSRLTGSLLAIALFIFAALVAWEMFVAALERYLARIETDSRRYARARTLFPMLRLIVLIVLAVVVGFLILGEIGINLGALIAGAGIFGLIAGFGSQSLLQDLITSIFVLVDDSFAVGDVISLGAGRAGVVEHMSIRAVKLRADDGSVLTIPFSEVKAIQNLTKDYSYYVANIAVGYREDTDRVVALLVAIAAEMQADAKFGPLMLAPLDVVGVDRFAESAVILIVRLKTLPIQQWAVGREFNRRVKKTFDENGIAMPFPSRTIYFGDQSEEAGAARERFAGGAFVSGGTRASAPAPDLRS